MVRMVLLASVEWKCFCQFDLLAFLHLGLLSSVKVGCHTALLGLSCGETLAGALSWQDYVARQINTTGPPSTLFLKGSDTLSFLQMV